MRAVESAGALFVAIILIFQWGCAGTAAKQNAAATTTSLAAAQLVSVSPNAVAAGHAAFTLTLKGLNFSNQSVVLWNGTLQTTTFVSSEELSAQISSQSVAHESIVPVVVKNAQSAEMSNALSVIVGNPPVITTTALPTGQAGASYSAPLTVSGGVAPFHWSTDSGVLPAGLSINSQTGTISGTAASAADSTVSFEVTDSLSMSASTSLAIKIAAATQTSPSSVSSSSGSAGYYGSGIGSDGLANTTVGPSGNTVSYRFRAKHSGVLQQALIYLIPDHPGYAGGTAGTTLVTLNTDDASPAHNPTSKVLASYVMSDVLSLPSPTRYFYTLKFAALPTLTAGQLYHLVFKSIDASPSLNFLSVDDMYELDFSAPVQDAIDKTDAAVLLSEGGSAWQPRAGYTPIYQLDFQDGVTEGIGYIEGWIGAPEPISGANAVREIFTVSGSDRQVSSVAVRVAHTSGNNPLVVRLENSDGSLVEEGSIAATAIPMSNSSSPAYFWAVYTFATPYTLIPGNTYHLDLEGSATSTYQAFPVRKGLAYGFQDTTYFPDGHAEFEQAGTWNGWTQWGVANRVDGDLQFYFSVVQ